MARVFIHNATNPVYNDTPDLLNLDQRALMMVKSGDALITREKIDTEYLEYLKNLGFPIEEVTFISPKIKSKTFNGIFKDKDIISFIKKSEYKVLSTFHQTEEEYEYSKAVNKKLDGNVFLSIKYGTKSGFREMAKKIGVAYADGIENIYTLEEVYEGVKKISEKYNRCVIKEDEGLGGRGSTVINCKDFLSQAEDEQIEIIKNAMGKMPQSQSGYIVEQWIDNVIGSPSVQIEVKENKQLKIISCHDQILKGFDRKYVGCVFPSRHVKKFKDDIIADSKKIANFLIEKGFIGFFGLDLVTTGTGYYWVEANIRKTATLYPRSAARILSDGKKDLRYIDKVYESKNLIGKSFTTIQNALNEISVNSGNKQEGVFISHFGTSKNLGRIGIMSFGPNVELREKYQKEAEKILSEI